MTDNDTREPDLPQVSAPLGEGTAGAVSEPLEKVAHSVPWSAREIWLAAALPGAILVILSMLILIGGDILHWSHTALDASAILFGPSLAFAGWLLLVRGRGTGRKELGLQAFQLRGSMLVPMLLVVDFIFVLAYTGLLDMYGALPFTKATETLPLAVINSVLVAPVCEEFFYRALLFIGLRRYYGPRRAAVFSAAVFAIYHLDPLFFVPLFISGIVLASLLDATGSIWPSILLHAAWNTWIEMGEAGFWIVALIAFLTMAVVAISPLWFAVHRFWQRAAGGPPSPPP